MSQVAITKLGPRHFRVDFGKLRRAAGPAVLSWFTDPGPVEVDPFVIAEAVRSAIGLCETRNVRGHPLVWNEYRLFLSRQDYQSLLPLVPRLKAGLDTVIQSTLSKLGAETVGDPVVRVLVDEEREVQPGTGDFLVAFVENRALLPERDGELTVRISGSGRNPPPPSRDEATQRVSEPVVAGALRLSWAQEAIYIAPKRKILVGRPHANPPPSFVALIGANQRVNRCHLTIENVPDGVVINRLAQANPVVVDGRLIQAGGKLSISELPVEILLSNGELNLSLERVQGSG